MKRLKREWGMICSSFQLVAVGFMLLNPLLSAAQQTLQQTQYTFNGLAVNPGYAGYKEDLTVRLDYRMQWTGLNGAPITGTVSVDGLAGKKKNTGLGLLAITDRLGPERTTSLYANYAYRLRVADDESRRLCFGIAAGVSQYTLDGSAFDPADLLDNTLPSAQGSRLFPDIRAGIYYCSSSAYIGLSAINLLSSFGAGAGNSLVKQVRHFYFTAGTIIPAGTFLDLKPSLLVKEDLKGPTNVELCNYLAFRKTLWIGASYRSGLRLWKNALQHDLDRNDAVAALAQVYFKERYRLGYSYDFTTSKLAGYQTGSHEISLSISFLQKKERIMSPRFF